MFDNGNVLLRERMDLSSGWAFTRGRVNRCGRHGQDASGSELVSLPHSWNMTDTFQHGVRYYQGTGSYQRQFVYPAALRDGQVWLCAEGFYGTGKVWLNNRLVGRINGQFLGFRLPVGDFLRYGNENHVVCQITNRCGSRELPGIRHPDFLLHGGLTGRVWLETSANCYLEADDFGVEAVAGESPLVRASTYLVNRGQQPVRADVTFSLHARDGSKAAAQICIPQDVAAGARVQVAGTLLAPDAQLWSDPSPHLYDFRATLRVNDNPVDVIQRRIGFRTAEFREGAGFFLNGERLMLRGCNRHENMPGCGSALSKEQHRADAAAIRDMGLNFVRLSHYPQSPDFLDACDEMGILVYAELASWKSVRGGSWLRKAKQQFAGMIRRDRHHPAVILWGMGNEGRHRKAFLELRALARELDPVRPVTYAENHLYRARRKGTIGIPDVWGCNYELDALAEGRDASRLHNVVVSECSNWPDAQRGDLEAERAQVDQLAQDLPRIEAVPYVAGFAIWCLADYATLRKSRYLRYSGVVDAWREPKLAAYWLRARYSSVPFVKLATDWQTGVDGANVQRRVDLFMSVARAEVRVNDQTVATFDGRGHHVLEVPFVPGCLSAVAVGVDGISDVIASYGPAVQLRLYQQPGVPETLRLEVLDEAGHLVRNWNGPVAWEGQGGARAFPYRSGEILVAAGCARIPIAMDASRGGCEWRVSGENLSAATLKLPESAVRE
ncbi:MAG: glycoside hydrolase family 2 protein [Kiritimatiellia bacterium]